MNQARARTRLSPAARQDQLLDTTHSFKFAAHLQAKQSGAAPVMIRIEKDAGHGAGTPTEKIIDQYADLFAFTLANMGD